MKFSMANTHKGYVDLMLIPLLLLIAVLSTSLATIAQATFSTSSSSKIALQAHQYAEAEAALIRATNYDELTAHERVSINNSIYESEVQVSGETETSEGIKQKTVSLLIYRSDEKNPRYTLKIPVLKTNSSSSNFKEWEQIPASGIAQSDGIIVITSKYNSRVYITTSGIQRTFAHGRSKYGVGQTSMTCPVKKGETYNVSGAAEIWFLKM